jgi:putative acetyltransferase
MPSGPELLRERFDAPDVTALAAAQQAELRGVYEDEGDIGPAREAHMFEPPDGAFFVVREDGRAVGCGGIARFDEQRGEVKRMYVVPAHRGRGLGRLILDAIEAEARELGYRGLVLETGDLQHEAVGLYRSVGFMPIPCYGVYASRTTSVCYEKVL